MLYYAGIVYGEVPELNAIKLQTIAVMFFLVEVAMTSGCITSSSALRHHRHEACLR